jgi:hypothetical protein
MRREQTVLPHTPEFSTTRSFPGVGTVRVEVSFEEALFMALILRALGERTPPMTLLLVTSAGRANIEMSTERRSISSEDST